MPNDGAATDCALKRHLARIPSSFEEGRTLACKRARLQALSLDCLRSGLHVRGLRCATPVYILLGTELYI
jgi:hypothetical protein